jgi:hypothetical protein
MLKRNNYLSARNFLTDEELAALGLVVSGSAQLESTLDLLIQSLANLGDQQFEVLVGGRMIGNKLDILKGLGLLKLKSQKKQQAFTYLINSLSSLNAERNTVVHGRWGPEGGITISMLSALFQGKTLKKLGEATHKKGRGKVLKLKAQRLEELALRLDQGNHDLYGFWKDNWLKQSVKRSLRRSAKS